MIDLRSRSILGGFGAAGRVEVHRRVCDSGSWTEVQATSVRLGARNHFLVLGNGLKFALSSVFLVHEGRTIDLAGGVLVRRQLPPPWAVPYVLSFTYACELHGDVPLEALLP